MAIYKVHIKTDGNVTEYKINETVLASFSYRTDLGRYEIETPRANLLADTAEDADTKARESVTAFLATLGVVPNFITE